MAAKSCSSEMVDGVLIMMYPQIQKVGIVAGTVSDGGESSSTTMLKLKNGVGGTNSARDVVPSMFQIESRSW